MFFHTDYWENLSLKRQLAACQKNIFQTDMILKENARLRSLLELRQRASYRTITATVIGRDFNMLRPYLILNKGRSSGVKKYAAIITDKGLVGKVLEVGEFSCKVMLVNDPDLSVPVINARSQEQGIASGSLDGRCYLKFLDLDSDIKAGDEIITSGLNLTYPADIAVGRVLSVGTESSGLGKYAVLIPAVPLASVETVLVVI